MGNNMEIKQQYTYIKEYRNKLYLKYYDFMTLEYVSKIIKQMPLRLYIESANESENTCVTIEGVNVAEYKSNDIKEYKNLLRTLKKDGEIDLYGVDTIECQYISKNFSLDVDLMDLNIPRPLYYDIETRFDGKRVNVKEAKHAVTLITGYDFNKKHSFAFGYKEDYTQTYDYYKHFENEKDLISHFFEYLKENNDIIIAHNGSKFDDPYLYYRAEKIGLGGKNFSPFGKVRTYTGRDKFGEYDAVDILGVSQIDSMDLLKVYYPPLPKYSLDYVAKTILGDEYGKVNYHDEGNLEKLYLNDYKKYIKYGYVDTILLKDIVVKLDILQPAILNGYIDSLNFDTFAGTVSNYENFIFNLIEMGIV